MAAIFSPEMAMAASKTSDEVTILPPAMMVSTRMSGMGGPLVVQDLGLL